MFSERFLFAFWSWHSGLMKIVKSDLLIQLFKVFLFLLLSFFNIGLSQFLGLFGLIEINQWFYDEMTDICAFLASTSFWYVKCILIIMKNAFFLLTFIEWILSFSWVFYCSWVFSLWLLSGWKWAFFRA